MDTQLDVLMGRRPAKKAAAPQPERPEPREDFPVLEPYVPIAMLFWRSTGSMQRPAMGGPPIGLDWPAVEVLARNTGVPLPLGEWVVDTLDAMAAAACTILHAQAERERDKS